MPTILISTARTFAASCRSSRPAYLAHLFMLAPLCPSQMISLLFECASLSGSQRSAGFGDRRCAALSSWYRSPQATRSRRDLIRCHSRRQMLQTASWGSQFVARIVGSRVVYFVSFHVKLADHRAKKRRASGSAGAAAAYATPSFNVQHRRRCRRIQKPHGIHKRIACNGLIVRQIHRRPFYALPAPILRRFSSALSSTEKGNQSCRGMKIWAFKLTESLSSMQ